MNAIAPDASDIQMRTGTAEHRVHFRRKRWWRRYLATSLLALGAAIVVPTPFEVEWVVAAVGLGLAATLVVAGSRSWSEACRIAGGRAATIRYVSTQFVTVEIADRLVDVVPHRPLGRSNLLRRHVTVLGLDRSALSRDPYQRRRPHRATVHLGSPGWAAAVARGVAVRSLLWALSSALTVLAAVL